MAIEDHTGSHTEQSVGKEAQEAIYEEYSSHYNAYQIVKTSEYNAVVFFFLTN